MCPDKNVTRDSARRGAEGRVPLRRERAANDPVRVSVVDVRGEPVDARVDALVCGWRTDAPAGNVTLDRVTAGYCQWGASATTGSDGVADLGPMDGWPLETERERGTSVGPAPPSIDPRSGEQLGAYDDADTSGTQLLLVARHGGQEHDWFGMRRLPAAVVLEASRSGNGPSVTLRHKQLYGPRPLTEDISDGHGVPPPQPSNYEYGSVAVWQTVPDVTSAHRLSVEVRSGLQSWKLGSPEVFGALGDDALYPTVDAFDGETARQLPKFAVAGGLVKGTLALDIEERAGPGESNVLSFGSGPDATESGAGTEQVQSYRPQLQRTAPGPSALSSAVAFELTTRLSLDGGKVPLYPALADTFEPPGGGTAGNTPSNGPAETLANSMAGELGDAVADAAGDAGSEASSRAARAGYTAGLVGGKAVSHGIEKLQGISAVSNLFDPAVDEPNNEYPNGPAFHPNDYDRVQTHWSLDRGDRRIAAVLEVPFRFDGGSTAQVRLRGGWTSLLRGGSGSGTEEAVHDRVNDDFVPITDRRVPTASGGGGGGR